MSRFKIIGEIEGLASLSSWSHRSPEEHFLADNKSAKINIGAKIKIISHCATLSKKSFYAYTGLHVSTCLSFLTLQQVTTTLDNFGQQFQHVQTSLNSE